MKRKIDPSMLFLGAIAALISLMAAYYLVEIHHMRVSNFLFGGTFDEAASFQFVFAVGFAGGVPLLLGIGAPLACFIEERRTKRAPKLGGI